MLELHRLQDYYDRTGNRYTKEDIVAHKSSLVLPPMPELPYLPKFYHTRFYNTYPAYCLGMVPITLGIQRFLDGARLYSAVMESVRFADSLAGDEFDETTYYIRFRVDAEQFLKDTGLYVGRSTIRTPLLTSKNFASYMTSYLQSQGYEVTLYE